MIAYHSDVRVLVQRVSEARVTVGGEVTGAIGRGLLLLVGLRQGDTRATIEHLARKVAALRIFPDDEGRMNRSVRDIGGEALAVSQFTLYGDTRRGNRPGFTDAMDPAEAEPAYEEFCRRLAAELGRPVPTGRFGHVMQVHLVNDGPVTILLERDG